MEKLTNADLGRWEELELDMKAAEKELSALKARAKAQGSISTKDYVLAVTEQSRTSLAGLELVTQVVDSKPTRSQWPDQNHGLLGHCTAGEES